MLAIEEVPEGEEIRIPEEAAVAEIHHVVKNNHQALHKMVVSTNAMETFLETEHVLLRKAEPVGLALVTPGAEEDAVGNQADVAAVKVFVETEENDFRMKSKS